MAIVLHSRLDLALKKVEDSLRSQVLTEVVQGDDHFIFFYFSMQSMSAIFKVESLINFPILDTNSSFLKLLFRIQIYFFMLKLSTQIIFTVIQVKVILLSFSGETVSIRA